MLPNGPTGSRILRYFNIKNTKVFFSTKSGCRQGGIESPPFFNCYFDWVMRKIVYSINNESKPSNNIQSIANYESNMANSAKEPYPCIIESNAIQRQEIQREYHLEPLSTSQSVRKTSSNNIQSIANYESNMANSAKEPYPCIIESNAIQRQEIQREYHLEPLSTSQSVRKTSYQNNHVIRNIQRKCGIQLDYHILSECTGGRTERNQINGSCNVDRILFADDGALLFDSKENLKNGLECADNVFTEYGLTLAYSKTETMVINGGEEESKMDSLIDIKGHKIKNTEYFKYLGSMVSPVDLDESLIDFRVKSAWAKFYSLKTVLLNKRLSGTIKGKYLNTFIRPRLCYGCPAWSLNVSNKNLQKISVAWNDMNRLVVNGGYKRKAIPPLKKKQQSQSEYDDLLKSGNWDYSFEYNTEKIYNINTTCDILGYIKRQQLKWIAHICRMENTAAQKQLLFSSSNKKNARDIWIKVETISGMDASQFRRLAMDRKRFLKWLEENY